MSLKSTALAVSANALTSIACSTASDNALSLLDSAALLRTKTLLRTSALLPCTAAAIPMPSPRKKPSGLGPQLSASSSDHSVVSQALSICNPSTICAAAVPRRMRTNVRPKSIAAPPSLCASARSAVSADNANAPPPSATASPLMVSMSLSNSPLSPLAAAVILTALSCKKPSGLGPQLSASSSDHSIAAQALFTFSPNATRAVANAPESRELDNEKVLVPSLVAVALFTIARITANASSPPVSAKDVRVAARVPPSAFAPCPAAVPPIAAPSLCDNPNAPPTSWGSQL